MWFPAICLLSSLCLLWWFALDCVRRSIERLGPSMPTKSSRAVCRTLLHAPGLLVATAWLFALAVRGCTGKWPCSAVYDFWAVAGPTLIPGHPNGFGCRAIRVALLCAGVAAGVSLSIFPFLPWLARRQQIGFTPRDAAWLAFGFVGAGVTLASPDFWPCFGWLFYVQTSSNGDVLDWGLW